MPVALLIQLVIFGLIGLGALSIPFFLRRVVEPNEVHIVQSRRGTKSYGKGQAAGNSYYAWPSWIPVVGIQTVVLPLANFAIRLDSYAAYDVGRVPFEVDIMAFFRIVEPNKAAERVTTIEELRRQLESVLQGAARTILAKEDVESIMSERSKFGEAFTKEVDEHLLEWGVCTVKSIELMDIRDSEGSKTISNIMAKKSSLIEMQSRTEVAENQKKAAIAETQAKRDSDLERQAADERVGQRTAEKDKNIGTANEKAHQEIAVEAAVTAEKNMTVQRVKEVRAAEITKEVQIVAAQQHRETAVINAEGDRQQTVIKAEGDKQQIVLKAEGDLAAAQRHAEGTQAIGTAEADVLRQKELAPVTAQITLAQEIGTNEGYQSYLVNIRRVEKDEAVGIEQAKALGQADIKVITNAGSPSQGLDKVMDIFSSKGGTEVGAMLEGLANTETGQAVLKRLGLNGQGAH